MAAAAAALVRRAVIVSPLPRGGVRPFASLTRPCVPLPKSTPTGRSPPTYTPRRLMHEGASKEELKGVEARVKEELKNVEARLQRLELEGNVNDVKEVVARLERLEVEISGKVFRLEVIATDNTGKVVSLKEAQSKQEDQLQQLKNFAYYEARRSTEQFAKLQSYHTQILVGMANTTYKLVLSGCGGFATIFLGGLQIYSVVSARATEKVVDACIDKKLEEAVEKAVKTALDQKLADKQDTKGP